MSCFCSIILQSCYASWGRQTLQPLPFAKGAPLHPSPGKLSVNTLEPVRGPDADLHSASRSLARCQHEPPKKPSSPRYRENLIGTGGRALTVGSLYGELISWKDLRALFKVCRVSEGATHHSAQPRVWHIWSGSFRVTCARTDR